MSTVQHELVEIILVRFNSPDKIREMGEQADRERLESDRLGVALGGNKASAESLSSGMDVLMSAMEAIGLGASIGAVMRMSDSYTHVINQLKLVTSSGEQLAQVERSVFDISQETKTSFTSNVDIFAALSRGARQYLATDEEVLNVVRTFAQAMDASGKSGSEVSTAIMQVGRGFASGELAGRGFLALFQQLPNIAQDLANKLTGGSLAALKDLAAQGKISGQQLLKALQESDKIAAQSAARLPTVGQAWTVVMNSFGRTVGQMTLAGGTMQQVASFLLLLADSMGEVVAALIIVGAGLLAYGAATLVVKLLTISLWAAVLANPFTAFVTLSAMAVVAFQNLQGPLVILSFAIALVASISLGISIIGIVAALGAFGTTVALLVAALAILGAAFILIAAIYIQLFSGQEAANQFLDDVKSKSLEAAAIVGGVFTDSIVNVTKELDGILDGMGKSHAGLVSYGGAVDSAMGPTMALASASTQVGSTARGVASDEDILTGSIQSTGLAVGSMATSTRTIDFNIREINPALVEQQGTAGSAAMSTNALDAAMLGLGATMVSVASNMGDVADNMAAAAAGIDAAAAATSAMAAAAAAKGAGLLAQAGAPADAPIPATPDLNVGGAPTPSQVSPSVVSSGLPSGASAPSGVISNTIVKVPSVGNINTFASGGSFEVGAGMGRARSIDRGSPMMYGQKPTSSAKVVRIDAGTIYIPDAAEMNRSDGQNLALLYNNLRRADSKIGI